MAAPRPRTLAAALGAAALTLLLAAPVAAQETIAHLIVEVINGDDGDVMGYRIHHEKHHAIYVAMLAPGGAGTRRCAVSASERLEVTEGNGPAAYFDGSDGEPCYLSVFAPDTGDSTPPGRPPVLPSHPCPTCPGR
ncbi:MAG: hypothetical protein QGH45_08670 [Myxococcota bacterium]|nr:hypothetical protein [Myxococcota bacterium]